MTRANQSWIEEILTEPDLEWQCCTSLPEPTHLPQEWECPWCSSVYETQPDGAWHEDVVWSLSHGGPLAEHWARAEAAAETRNGS